MNQLLIYTEQQSERLRYISNFLFEQGLGLNLHYTNDESLFNESKYAKIAYSNKPFSDCLSIGNAGLLFEQNISKQMFSLSVWENLPCFYLTESADLPFDLLSASFYLLSRYEEYLPHALDSFQRFPVEESIAFKQQFLSIPLIDLWMIKCKGLLVKQHPSLKFKEQQFNFQPTYDIDIAYSYLGKGFFRNLGGAMRDLLSGKWKQVAERMAVLSGRQKDPYDSYEFVEHLHEKYGYHPIYFLLLSQVVGRYDKNIAPKRTMMQSLIQRLGQYAELGIHPSYASNDDKRLLFQEINLLELVKSRQHYIRFELPNTFRQLMEAGIKADYSMGYGSINGFRASTSFPHAWFDLEKNHCAELMLHPFCFMECNSFFEQGYSLEETKQELLHYFHAVKAVNGNLITIWHNFSLGSSSQWKGWSELYEWFLSYVKEN